MSEWVDVRDDVDAALAHYSHLEHGLPQMLVVNAGDSWRAEPPAFEVPAESIAGLNRIIDHGVPIFAAHTAAASLRSYPRWAATAGGMWVPEISWHPPAGPAQIDIVAEHPITRGFTTIETVDERYTDLQLLADVQVLATQQESARHHPVIWAHTMSGGSKVVYSALGHDGQAYESQDYQKVLLQTFQWLMS